MGQRDGTSCPVDTVLLLIGFILPVVRSKEQSALCTLISRAEFPAASWFTLTSQTRLVVLINAYVEPKAIRCLQSLAWCYRQPIIGLKVMWVVDDAGTAIKVRCVGRRTDSSWRVIITAWVGLHGKCFASKDGKDSFYDACEVVAGRGLPDSTARAVTEGCHEMVLGCLRRIHRPIYLISM